MNYRLIVGSVPFLALFALGCDPVCQTDSDCAQGEVCELSTGCEEPSLCVAGCHADSDCGAGQVCNQVQCITCPCPGICEDAAGPGCTSDGDCPHGEVCELDTGCVEPASCLPGCRDDSDCNAGETCNVVQCFTCPCPGICQ